MSPSLIVAIAQSAIAETAPAHAGASGLINSLTVFVLACFIGYYVVWRVTPALHSPLMAVTNAVSSVIFVGAVIAAGARLDTDTHITFSQVMGFCAVVLASINIFGGFFVAQRMLSKFKKRKP
jgi:NAD(P) transhydrogenase subunit alpha